MKRKITVTTGSRSDYGLLRRILWHMTQNKKLDLFLIVTGMHLSRKYGLTINEIKKDGFKINTQIKMLPNDDTLFSSTQCLGRGVIQFSKVFHRIKPDINLVLGDRDEMLASSLAAYHMGIPNAHIHGGDKSGGLDEYNRHAITKISNIHFVATRKSKERVIRMGENTKHVILTGSPSIDEIKSNHMISANQLERKYNMSFTGNEILVVYHPVTTQIQSNATEIHNILAAIVKTKKPTIVIAPNSDAGNKLIFKEIEKFSKKYNHIKSYASIPRSDYLGMLKNCGVLVGNSSSGIIEASYLGIPVVNIGIRQKNREHGGKHVIHAKRNSVSYIHREIISALKIKKRTLSNNSVYGTGNASINIVNYLEKITLDKNLTQKQIAY